MTGTVIIGTGIAGVSAAGALRASGYAGDIVLVGDEHELPYRRPPVSKEMVRGEKTADQIRIKQASWYETQRIDLRLGTGATALDTAARKVALSDGTTLAYDQVLLATGGSARQPWSADGIRTLRSLADVPALTADLAAADHAVVVGAGLIGSEIAASARSLGLAVTLLETASQPLPRLLPPVLASLYADLHTSEGTQLHTGVRVTAIDDSDGATVVTAEDGRSWSAPVVVVAVGMQPNVDLAEAAGLDIAAEVGGIVVDAAGRTSAPGVFAAGDVAALPHPFSGGLQRIEHWQHAQRHGTAVGQAMGGADVGYDEVPWCWSDQYGHNLQVTGWPEAEQDLVVRGSIDERDFTAFFLDGGVIRGAVSIGRPAEVRLARTWIAAAARPDVSRIADEDSELADSVTP